MQASDIGASYAPGTTSLTNGKVLDLWTNAFANPKYLTPDANPIVFYAKAKGRDFEEKLSYEFVMTNIKPKFDPFYRMLLDQAEQCKDQDPDKGLYYKVPSGFNQDLPRTGHDNKLTGDHDEDGDDEEPDDQEDNGEEPATDSCIGEPSGGGAAFAAFLGGSPTEEEESDAHGGSMDKGGHVRKKAKHADAQQPTGDGVSDVKGLAPCPSGTQLKSGITDDSQNHVGGGGCVAWSLFMLGLFKSVDGAKKELNDCISTASVDPKWSVPDDTWHPEVVKQAVTKQGYHFNKINLETANLRAELKTGDLLVDGVLNNSFVKSWRGEESRYYTDEEDKTTPVNNEGGWRHATAVHNGRILDKEIDMPVRWMWICSDNKPDKDKAYFYKICKVYRIVKCTGPLGCKGACKDAH
jgi:hypothetical protein